MSSIAGYRSPLNLPIGQVPLTSEAELFEEMTEVYNAIHLINQYLDKLRIGISGGGSGQTPAETIPFTRFYTAPALSAITIGMAVAPFSGGNGVSPGCLASDLGAGAFNQLCCVALTAGGVGDDIRVGVGPAALAVPGALSGVYVWAYSNKSSNGTMSGRGGIYPSNPGATSGVGGGTVYPIPVGIGVTTGFAIIGPMLWR